MLWLGLLWLGLLCLYLLQIALGKPLQLQSSEGGVSSAPLLLRVSRPPEPSDVLWENLPCSRLQCGLRQLLVTLIMFGVSMAGTVLIVGFSYASPHFLPGYGLDEAIGTTFIIIGYLLVFILVPRLESTYYGCTYYGYTYYGYTYYGYTH